MRERGPVWVTLAGQLFLAAMLTASDTAQGQAIREPTGQADLSEAAHWREGWTDRELAIGRWFSQLTFRQDRTAQPWPQWHADGKQLGTTSLRYQLAFAGYGCAVMAAKTPAYRELVEQQLGDLCQRMLDVRVWSFVTHYWQYGDTPPDPCRYENVMYTGHLTQLMCLYELLTGDTRYSDAGWDFVWRDGRKVHYNLQQAVERLYVQSANSPHGGICCEPNLVFATCNSHSAASFLLFDLLHGTQYAQVNDKWYTWMSQNFRIKNPSSGEFLNLLYHQDRRLFVPVGDAGADGWTLGWGYPWFPSPDLALEGWQHILAKTRWQRPEADQCFAPSNLLVACCGGGSAPVSNAFLPLLAVQVEGRDSPTACQVLRWLEAKFGRETDLDGDGHRESYYYHTDEALRIATTGNIAAALATDGDSLRQLFRTPRRHLLAEPTVAHVDYPNVYLRTAEFVAPVLRFTILQGQPSFHGPTEIVCTQIPPAAVVTRDGEPISDFQQTGSTVVIRTDVDCEHVFEVTVRATPSN
ncbi:MAG: hypothetical protein NTY19_25345 [Planctomycetota bacterium]|nr:hypothetical protein [Planctomycetota bacterium]